MICTESGFVSTNAVASIAIATLLPNRRSIIGGSCGGLDILIWKIGIGIEMIYSTHVFFFVYCINDRLIYLQNTIEHDDRCRH